MSESTLQTRERIKASFANTPCLEMIQTTLVHKHSPTKKHKEIKKPGGILQTVAGCHP